MTLLLADGFENRAVDGAKFTHYNSNFATSPAHRYNAGGTCLTESGTGTVMCSRDLTAGEQDSRIITQFAFGNTTGVWAGIDCLFLGIAGGALGIGSISTYNLLVGIAGGKIVVKRPANTSTTALGAWTTGATVLASVDPVGGALNGIWQYFEIDVLLHASAGTVTIKQNGVTILTLTGVNTAGTSTTAVSVAYCAARISGGGNAALDDVILMNGLGSSYNALLGEVRMDYLTANANGNYSQLLGSDGNSVNNFQQVDDATGLAAPNTSDYNGSPTVGQKDTYGFTDLPAAVTTVLFAIFGLYAAKSDTGAKSMRRISRRSSTDATGADFALTPSYVWYFETVLVDPVGGGAWTVANLNATEMGPEVRT